MKNAAVMTANPARQVAAVARRESRAVDIETPLLMDRIFE
jgi:hypothetical protein